MTSRTSAFAQWRYSAAAVFAASVLVLSACNGGGSPQGTGGASESAAASASASPSPSATPTPSAVYKPADAKGKAQNVPVPVLPDAAKAETKEGLEAFAKYWYATLSYAYETGDTSLVKNASGPDCVFCSGLAGGVESAWRDGRWIEGGTIETPSITVQYSPSSASQATIQVLQKQIGIRKPDGSLYQEPTKATNTGSHATATYGAKGWIISDLGLIR
ncbi:DUF6318 family protein [Arthrobacter oryzae]|uniref:DUF6318 family protein n=1 Tax=Arthrobacter oryzae TaxID=409290 RepID=UPI00273CEA22|nr:DUF6318 family protein [Arthrobacter oryzae]WLQ04943.1 DUF6318 family protein [Arthrobacter oryzae]